MTAIVIILAIAFAVTVSTLARASRVDDDQRRFIFENKSKLTMNHPEPDG